jgi:hypothetical protein
MSRPGRNDPCPCGSGKKYKRCHLGLDARNGVSQPPARSETGAFAGLATIKNAWNQLRDGAAQGSARERREFGKIIAEAEPILDYLEHREEIEAACNEMEAHRPEFDKLMADPERLNDLAATLFSEECFTVLRFAPTDVTRAFDHVGYPAMMSPDERTVETLRLAILHLADGERRRQIALKLLSLLPEFTAAGRFIEAWLIQYSAYETAERNDESNPFLFHMFALSYDAWAAEKKAHDKSLLQELGIDVERLGGMTMDELDEWLAAQAADPSKTRAMEAFFEQHPDARAESVANLEAMQRGSVELLKREDCQHLLLPSHEIEPWLNRLNDELSRRLQDEGPLETHSEESVGQILADLLLPRLREMAESVFTQDRIQRLISNLKKYRSEKFAAGDRDAATMATGAINYLEREDQPGQNAFLIQICWASLSAII